MQVPVINMFAAEQALADYAVLIRHIKNKFNAQRSPVIAFGGTMTPDDHDVCRFVRWHAELLVQNQVPTRCGRCYRGLGAHPSVLQHRCL